MAKAKPKAPAEVLERIDPDEDFSDVDGDLNNEFMLSESQQNSDRHRVWVHNNVDTIREYRDGVLHYAPVHDAEGVVVTRRDHVLMDCDQALFLKRDRFERLKNLKERATLSREAQKALRVYQQGAAE